jgi:hypothetical protein
MRKERSKRKESREKRGDGTGKNESWTAGLSVVYIEFYFDIVVIGS